MTATLSAICWRIVCACAGKAMVASAMLAATAKPARRKRVKVFNNCSNLLGFAISFGKRQKPRLPAEHYATLVAQCCARMLA